VALASENERQSYSDQSWAEEKYELGAPVRVEVAISIHNEYVTFEIPHIEDTLVGYSVVLVA